MIAAASPGIDELRSISVFADLTPDQLDWLASQITVIELEPGEVFLTEGSPADRLFVVFKGELRGRREKDHTDDRIFIAPAGRVTGMLPYSRLTHFPLTTRAVVHSRVGSLPKERFPE